MMEAVVDVKGATGTQAAVDGYRVAGKTGTGKRLVDGQYTQVQRGLVRGHGAGRQPAVRDRRVRRRAQRHGRRRGRAGVQQDDVVRARPLPGAAVRHQAAQVQDLSVGWGGAWRLPRCRHGVGSDAVPGIPRPQSVPPYRGCLAAHAGGPDRCGPRVTGITHSSSEVRPGDLYAALPGAGRHGAEFAAAAVAAGAVAVLTDPAGQPAAAAAGLPVLVVDDPRAVLGAVASADLRRSDGRPDHDRHHRYGRQDVHGVPDRVRIAARPAWSTGLIGTVETRLGDLVVDSVRTTPEATDLHAMLAVARERGVRRGGHGGVQPRPGDRPGRRGPVRRRRLHQLRPRPPRLPPDRGRTTSRPRPSLFDGRCRYEVLNLDDPALRPLFKPATISYSDGRRGRGDLAGGPTSGRRRSGSGSRPSARTDARRGRGGPARPAQRGQRAAGPRRAGRRPG